MSRLTIALVADGKVSASSTNSGVALGLSTALRQHENVDAVIEIDGSLRGFAKILVGIATFHPVQRRWRARVTKGRLSTAVRSILVERVLKGSTSKPDITIQLRNTYRPLSTPYVVFLDNTAALTQEAWPQWSLPPGEFNRRLASDSAQFRAARMVFTAGSHVADSVVTTYGVAKPQVRAVGGGLNFSLPATMPTPNVDHPTILFVGTEFIRKGGDLLVEAFREVRRSIPAAELVLVGGDFPVEASQGITLKGRITSRDELSKIFSSASIFCLPARFEPYGLVLQEAMAHGIPCVGSACCAIPEILSDDCGRIVPVGDVESLATALTELLLDPAERQRLATNAWHRAKSDLTWAAVADRIVNSIGSSGHQEPPDLERSEATDGQ